MIHCPRWSNEPLDSSSVVKSYIEPADVSELSPQGK
jgi:hypothetical protein